LTNPSKINNGNLQTKYNNHARKQKKSQPLKKAGIYFPAFKLIIFSFRHVQHFNKSKCNDEPAMKMAYMDSQFL
jgi:hypothetical protein